MSFDYHWTCPDIDQTIDELKDQILSELIEAVEKIMGDNCSEDEKQSLQEYSDCIYELVSGAVEKIRDTNSDMRKEASSQIGSLQDKVDELKSELVNK